MTLRRPGEGLPDLEAPLSKFLLVLTTATILYSFASAAWWKFCKRLPRVLVHVALFSLLAVVILVFLFFYMKYGSPRDSSGYGDEDDALDLLVKGLFSGVNPYGSTTYMGNPLSPLMGGAVLATAPYFIFGYSGFLNVILVPVMTFAILRVYGPRVALFLFGLCFASLGFTEYFLLGGDFFTTALLCCVACFWYVRTAGIRPLSYLTVMLLAVVCTTRASLLPILFGTLLITLWAKRTQVLGEICFGLGIAGTLILPWLILSWPYFFPLQTMKLLGPPSAQVLLLTLMIVSLAYATLVSKSVSSFWVLSLAILPVIFWTPDQLFRASIFIFWAVPILISSNSFIGSLVDGDFAESGESKNETETQI
ncbi:hypothetical protein EV383_4836 [Pseudonocardia sediminis]|uniref:Dolichyl-phosphate-mannose-protein mannosyltransferase n=1 Tax=Pseudonocardia sediminis TaxID=1397368 RepID=A0A4Q7V333_PSEST|nr:hypothetical protein [Pseudonocardia sediminis]RZT87904.1 hypothetical protein EV383_4836 [Pseudonocardia sediminis]